MPELIELAAGSYTLLLSPTAGGSIARFRHGARDIMRPAGDAALQGTEPRAMACYPLVPYSNRIAGGAFDFGRRRIQLRRNVEWDASPLHGVGWHRAWRAQRVDASSATLVYNHAPDLDWPFAFHAELRFALAATGLTVALLVVNAGDDAQPVGLGLHPYWPLTPEAKLTAAAPEVWLADTRKLPILRAAVPPRWNFAGGRKLAPAFVDNCFAGWNGTAVLAWPDLEVVMRAEAIFGHLVIASPLGETYCAVEPATHVNDGFNQLAHGRTDTGVRILAPGEQFGGKVHFAARSRP